MTEENQDIVQAELAFLVLRMPDGSWHATTDLESGFAAQRRPSRAEVRVGCAEIVNLVTQQELSEVIANAVAKTQESDSEKISASMREAVAKAKAGK
jgi:hypothetical protein